jgi:SAM domain (Sterile alpha motif)
MDIAAWLQDLELQRYVSAFRDNDIDGEILSKLTAEDLIGIGVTSVGIAASHIARLQGARERPSRGCYRITRPWHEVC